MPPPTSTVPPRIRAVTPSNVNARQKLGDTGGRGVQSANRRARGYTPNNRNDTPIQSTGFLQDPSLPLGVPKLNLTPEQELEILERLDSGDYDPQAGWAQFLNPIRKKEQDRAGKPKFRHNLNREFENAEMSRSLTTPGSFNENLNHRYNKNEKVVQRSPHELPLFFQKVDEIMQAIDDYKMLTERTVDAIVAMHFAEIFPESCGHIVEKMEKAIGLMENFMTHSTSSTTKLLVHQQSPKKNQMRCAIEKQENFISTVYNLSDQMKKFSNYLVNSKSGLQLEDKLETLEGIIQTMEHNVHEAEKNMKKIEENEIIRKTLTSNFTQLSIDESGMSTLLGSVYTSASTPRDNDQ